MTRQQTTRINRQIRASQLRVIGSEGENIGVVSFEEAIKRAEAIGLDLIEISPNAEPPVAKIMDYGKFQYEQNKKVKVSKHRAQKVELKSLQVKVGTGEHDLAIKAKNASKWLKEGNRVRIELFLSGRAKFMDGKFLEERLDRILKLISEDYKISEPAKRGPKGLMTVLEKK